MKRKLLNLALGTVATLSMSSLATQAQAITLDLSFTGQSTAATGTGSVTIDDALLTPNQTIINSLAGFTAFQATFTDLPNVPSSTTFNLSDVDAFALSTDSNGSIEIFNFVATTPNADDFFAVPPAFVPAVILGQGALDNQNFIDAFAINTEPVPEPSFLLATGIAGGVGTFLKKRKKKVAQA